MGAYSAFGRYYDVEIAEFEVTFDRSRRRLQGLCRACFRRGRRNIARRQTADPFAFRLSPKKSPATAGLNDTPHWCCYYNVFFSSSSYCLSPAAPRAGLVTPLPEPHFPHFGGVALTGLVRPQIRH
jgi:hypothetical protein